LTAGAAGRHTPSAMHVFFSETQTRHSPQKFLMAGKVVAPFETPDRCRVLARSLAALGLPVIDPGDHGMQAIRAVHDAGYLDFLKSAHAEWSRLPASGPEVWPNIHPWRGRGADQARKAPPPGASIVGRAGWYVGDMAVAMGEGTWEAAYASAQAAIAGATALLTGHTSAFALCRPPGHHAYADRASGFCFLNNAAIAAERLRRKFAKVAILDFDTHHGDGTQAIFDRRGDVFFGSVHTDPTAYYPFYSGFAEEAGRAGGRGATLNIPLPQGADDASYIAGCARLVRAAAEFGAEAVVLSAGWDAHKDDPLSKLAVTTAAFSAIGHVFGALPVPVLVVQEGGYSPGASAEAVPAFLGAFRAARPL
jgi:acetoin utilization deacetylase AcuC-like enzyme